MLNHELLCVQLQQMSLDYQKKLISDKQHAAALWSKITKDDSFQQKLQLIKIKRQLPSWQGQLQQVHKVNTDYFEYSVLGVDGSQIYPDRHQGFPCYVLNIGTVIFHYGEKSCAILSSQPFLMTPLDEDIFHSQELVNCQRTAFEFNYGFEKAREIQNSQQIQIPVLFDGSLIFWHLFHKDEITKQRFIKEYMVILEQFYIQRLSYVSYISLPKSRELIAILQAAQTLPEYIDSNCSFDSLVDADIVAFFLKPYERTILFIHHDTFSLPHFLHTCFFYFHNGVEIVRIEVPYWIAKDEVMLEHIATIVANQSIKGNGYPVCLAEAHEQAVVSTIDREYFYAILEKSLLKKNGFSMGISQKNIHKRNVGI